MLATISPARVRWYHFFHLVRRIPNGRPFRSHPNVPVAISRVSNEQNLEGVNAEQLQLRCSYCEKVSDSRNGQETLCEEWPN